MGLSGEAVMAVEWSLFACAYVLVGLRLGVRIIHQQQKRIIVSDIFLVFSAIVCLGLIICDTLTYRLGAMNPETTIEDTVTADELAKQVALDKISFASNYFYDYGMYYPKFTILALYFELFPNTMPKLRMSLYIATAFTVMCSFTTLGLVTFYCKNVSDNWSLEPGKCSSFNSLLVLQIDWAMNFSSDVAIFALPFPLLRVLRLRRRQRYGLLLTFTLGLVTIAVNLARFITVQIGSDWNNLYVWSMAEMSVAIIVVSMPALKYLLTSWRKLAGSGTESSSYYNSSAYDGQRSSRRHNQISCTLADDTGSDVELNRVMREDVIVKTKEVSVDSRPAGGGGSYSLTNQSWEKETRSSGDESRPPR